MLHRRQEPAKNDTLRSVSPWVLYRWGAPSECFAIIVDETTLKSYFVVFDPHQIHEGTIRKQVLITLSTRVVACCNMYLLRHSLRHCLSDILCDRSSGDKYDDRTITKNSSQRQQLPQKLSSSLLDHRIEHECINSFVFDELIWA